jgi:nucleoside-diphosphate-sugar epimerase
MKKIFITGVSGCIGQYFTEMLIEKTDYELFLLVRNPDKLRFDWHARSNINILPGDLRNIEQYAELLGKVNVAILAATAWGGREEVFDTNVAKTLSLIKLLNPAVCQQVIYFSTASILDRENHLLPEAKSIGTDYISSKYECFAQLSQLTNVPPITTVFPTLVLGGDGNKPYSHLSGGLPEVAKYIGLIRWFKADAGFHFIHSADIAQVIYYLVDHPAGENRQLVLGNPAVTANQVVESACSYFNKTIYFRIPLSLWLANVLIKIFKVQMADWDRFSMNYRYFTYQNPVNPKTFDLPCYAPSIEDIFRVAGF